MPEYPHIQRYHDDLERLITFGGSDSEGSIRRAFENCLNAYCSEHKEPLTLVAELATARGIRPDGTVKDSLRMARGYWEAKDTHDDLKVEIERKFDRGYPNDNIIFEDSETAILYQNGELARRADMRRPGELHRLIRLFLDYELPEIEEFRTAQRQFADDLPTVLGNLRDAIDGAARDNSAYQRAAAEFLDLCRRTIGPDVTAPDVTEMLLQHILTKDIFLRIFAEDQFHRENNIAQQLTALEETFFTGSVRRDAIDRLRSYYGAIGRAADEIVDYGEKQAFLKAVYEDFYKAYNPKAADRLGVVYTPNEVVDFMIRGADYLLERHFGRQLADDNVQILDPATGTGTFITSLIEHLPADRREYKYLNEIHANEVAILPYYIANLNIEYTYRHAAGRYLAFPNLCFVDTLDNVDWNGGSEGAVERQAGMNLGGLTAENWVRIQQQNEATISVIIGNPPYNANQQNANDQNPNREYPAIDQRIRDSYVRASSAQKTKQYDMYKRFIRWASDRLSDDGIIAFVTNRAYLDARQDDGFRLVAADEFTDIYVLDLSSDVRRNPKIRGTTHNVFGIQTGVAIAFFIRDHSRLGECSIRYSQRDDAELAADTLLHLRSTSLDDVPFRELVPDQNARWLNQSSTNFADLLPVATRETKQTKAAAHEAAIFAQFCTGVSTNRDSWVYDFDRRSLQRKIRWFIAAYNQLVDGEAEDSESTIKWSEGLLGHFSRKRHAAYSAKKCMPATYRPFVRREYYADQMLSDRLTERHAEMFGRRFDKGNRVICVSGFGSTKPFSALAVDRLSSLDLLEKTQCLPLYRYTSAGRRQSNVTDWGLAQFRDHYGDQTIGAEEIFAYVYAALHDPVYRETYAVELLQEFPRLPFHDDFREWARIGEALLELHIGFEEAEPWALERVDGAGRPGKPKLRADKAKGIITLDGRTSLAGVPPEAWDYVLGSRSALEWVLDQHKEKKPRDATVRERFDTYRFADHKERVIDLLRRVCTVSVRTMELIDELPNGA